MSQRDASVVQVLEQIRTRLLDLSRRNRLLNYRHNKLAVRIVDEQPRQVYSRLVSEGKTMKFWHLPDPEDLELELVKAEGDSESLPTKEELRREVAERAGVDVSYELPAANYQESSEPAKHTDGRLQTALFKYELETRLRRIRSKARSVVEETGMNQLFLAMGFLQWKDRPESEDSWLAPLILIPVELQRGRLNAQTHSYEYVLGYSGEDLITNISLSVKLEQLGAILPEFSAYNDGDNDGEELDPELYLTSVSRAIEEKKGWKVHRQMVLGFFKFSKILMWRDLDPTAWPDGSLTEHPIVKALIGSESLPDSDFAQTATDEESRAVDEYKLPIVVDADSSQSKAIKMAMDGRSFIIQGPPGTGKSQTITNLVSCFIDEGKSVLFVAEKMAALDVVKRNMERIGLADFCLELHSYKAQKKQVLDSLERRTKLRVSSPDDLDGTVKFIQNTVRKLAQYVLALRQPIGPFAETVFQVIGKTERLRGTLVDAPSIFFEKPETITSSEFENSVSVLESLARCVKELGTPGKCVWHGYDASVIRYGDEEVVSAVLAPVVRVIQNSVQQWQQLADELGKDLGVSVLSLCHLRSLAELPDELPEALCRPALQKLLLEDDKSDWEALRTMYKSVMDYQNAQTEYKAVFGSVSDLEGDKQQNLDSLLSSLLDAGLETVTLETAEELAELASELGNLLLGAQEVVDRYVIAGFPEPQTWQSLNGFVASVRLLQNQPAGLRSTKFEVVFDDKIKRVFTDLMENVTKLLDAREGLSTRFVVKFIPEADVLSQLQQEIRVGQEQHFTLFNRDYRDARKQLLKFARKRSVVKSSSLPQDLEELEDFVREREKLHANVQFAEVFGKLFKGLDTDLDLLREIVLWATKLREYIPKHVAIDLIAQDATGKLPPLDGLAETLGVIRRVNASLSDLARRVEWSDKYSELSSYPPSKLAQRLATIAGELRALLDIGESLDANSAKTVGDLAGALAAFARALVARSNIEGNSKAQQMLDNSYRGVETDSDAISGTACFAQKIRDLNLPNGIFEVFAKECSRDLLIKLKKLGNDHFEKLNSEIDKAMSTLNRLGKVQEDSFWGEELDSIVLADLEARLSKLLVSLDSLVHWADYCRLAKDAEQIGLHEIVRLLHTGKLNSNHAVDTYKFAVYTSLCRNLLRQNKVLSRFTRSEYEEKRSRFSRLDQRIMVMNRMQTAYHTAQRYVPKGNRSTRVGELTDKWLLQHEFAKQKRHIPLRRLMERAGKAIRGLKPVFMMSPMSIAQFLAPGKHEFDVVIMDEASQILPEDALGAVARAKQLIVVGDSKQLPPTTFFRSEMDNADADEQEMTVFDDMDESVSILDKCEEADFKSSKLLWHYRSEHESLIAFSNRQWYDNELIIFPSAGRSDTELGIKYHFVDGAKYSKGKNETEADVVAKNIVEHAIRSPQLSLGVATFNLKQRDLIEDRLNTLTKKDPAFDLAVSNLMKASDGYEPLFIKNLENVQGDQRDVIFISCTFGPDAGSGEVLQRFGPINKNNGWRRLNVLFTRAKKRMEIFSSMRAEDVRADPGAEGRIALKGFLKYAQTGQLPDFGTPSGKGFDSDFEECVAQCIQNMGYDVVPQVGVAGYFVDIGVLHPNRNGEFLIGVECDGATYHSSIYARDRDRLREEVLFSRGWRLHRIWSTEWFKNKKKEVDRLKTVLETRLKEDTHVAMPDEQDSQMTLLTEIEPLIRMSDEQLEKRLKVFCHENIKRSDFQQEEDGFLHPDILAVLVQRRPVDRESFRSDLPSSLRGSLNPDDLQYLDDIFEIIEQAG